MAGLARRLAPAAALGGIAIAIVGIADPAIAGRTDATATGETLAAVPQAAAAPADTTTSTDAQQQDTTTSDATTQPQDTTTQQQGTSTGNCSTTVEGDTIQTRWGPVQVVATVDGTTVCEVRAVQWPDGDGRSAQISSYAIPQLDSSATAYFQDGTQFQYVSGATYTSDGYVQSIQSILDKL